MVHIQAFRGLRFDPKRVGNLSDVVAPPYDVIDPQLQSNLYNRSPFNVVRLILNRTEPGDPEGAVYERAGQSFRDWKRDGVLSLDKTPAIYMYQQEFDHEGVRLVRRGFMARVRLEPFGSGTIYPHEQTHARVKEDRLRLTQSCRANLSQIFGIFPDPKNEVLSTLEKAPDNPTPLTASDHLGTISRYWPITDGLVISKVIRLMSDRPIFVADGHHRYETACAYRDFVARQRPLDPDDPAHFVLMMCVGMSDPGLIVLPTHRLFRGFNPIDSTELRAKLDGAFEVTTLGNSISDAADTWRSVSNDPNPSTLGLFTAKDSTWNTARITQRGRDLMRAIAADHEDDWRQLGVSVLHELVIKNLLGYQSMQSPRYVHSIAEVIADLRAGDSIGRDATGQQGTNAPFQLAALVRPATVDDVRRISLRGERMPAKSTYFYPKLLTGLVINPLE